MIADNQMHKRDERFSDQGKNFPTEHPPYNKQATGQAKVIKRFAHKDFQFRVGQLLCIYTYLLVERWPPCCALRRSSSAS